MTDHRKAPEPSEDAREEVGDAESSSKHPPHADERGPVLPANASGEDSVPTDEQDQSIDETSMYDRRPEEHKDHKPG